MSRPKRKGDFNFLLTIFKRIFCWSSMKVYFISDISTFLPCQLFACITISLNRIYAYGKYSKHSINVYISCVIIDKLRNFMSLNTHPFVFSSTTKTFFRHTKNNILIKHDTCNFSLKRSVNSFFVWMFLCIMSYLLSLKNIHGIWY